MAKSSLPLGRSSDIPKNYDPGVLFAIARADSRKSWQAGALPFHGADLWTAWELTWLGDGNLPVAAVASISVPAESPVLVESKSLKLYLNSFSMTRFANVDAVAAAIRSDLSDLLDANVTVAIAAPDHDTEVIIAPPPGRSLDGLSVECSDWQPNADLLHADPNVRADETLHSTLLRSLCPVTAQPDFGTLIVRYVGPRIDQSGLLKYIVSFREHNDFHEACVETMFVDLLDRCAPEKLTVYARYGRRGGIDINPFRSNFEPVPQNLRLWRQ